LLEHVLLEDALGKKSAPQVFNGDIWGSKKFSSRLCDTYLSDFPKILWMTSYRWFRLQKSGGWCT